jgi:hypothetical protein
VIPLRPGVVLQSNLSGDLFVLLYERFIDNYMTGMNWAMLDLQRGVVCGEWPSLLRSGHYSVFADV